MGFQIINRFNHIYVCFLAIVLGIIAPIGSASAEKVTVSLLELQTALEEANQGTDSVARDVFARINEAINQSDFGFSDGELLYSSSESNITVEGGCNRTTVLQMDTDIKLNADTSLSLTLDSLYDPIVVSLDVNADIKSIGEAQQILGFRLEECTNLVSDSFNFNAVGPARFTLDVSLMLNPEWTADSTLSLFPSVSLSGELKEFSLSVDVDDTVLASLLETYIEQRIDETFSNARFVQEIAGFQDEANNSLTQSLTDGRIDIELPEATDDQIIALYQYLQPEARFPISLDMIRANRQRILSAMVFGEPNSVDGIFSDALLCESASVFLSSNTPASIYTKSADQCVAVAASDMVAGDYWSDMSCSNAIRYKPTSVSDYCAVALDPDRLGNAALLNQSTNYWTHSPGTQLDIGALSVDGLTQPIMHRYKYKTVETARGTCELEMRVYSGDSSDTELGVGAGAGESASASASASAQPKKPLIALHGGSWQHRASGFIGVEATAAHFTNNDFVVFAPFYRLIGESDGNVSCNDANLSDVLSDVNDAMNWVLARSTEFGVAGKPTLFGQSAGGHLALSLSVNRPEDVRRSVLLYTPSDFGDFANQISSGAYTNPAGFKILETVTGDSIEALDAQSPLVLSNSFPAKIAAAPESYPPMFILHGEMDSLLPYRQSVRLCNALSGSEDLATGPASLAPNLSSFASVTQCNAQGSTMHLIAEGDHALDLCLAPGLCLSGSAESASAVAQSMQAMVDWSSADSVAVQDKASSRSGLGGVNWSLLVLLFGGVVARKLRISSEGRVSRTL